MVPAGIRFNDCLFTEPVRFSEWTPPRYAGLFVILANDVNWAPKPFQPLYFGEFGNNAHESLLADTYAPLRGSEDGTILFISLLPMPFSTTAERWAIRNQLLWAYNPTSQTKEVRAVASEQALRLSAVDNKPRRRIGFL